jgi:hypothetical protein
VVQRIRDAPMYSRFCWEIEKKSAGVDDVSADGAHRDPSVGWHALNEVKGVV